MKKFIVFIFAVSAVNVLIAQTSGEQKSLKYESKSEIKAVSKEEVKSNNGQTSNDSKVTGTEKEPVIIQRLEYTAPEKKSENVSEKTEDVTPSNQNIQSEKDPLAQIESQINAIDKKVAWVKSNPEEDKKAKENGWYNQMETYRAECVSKKEEIIKSKK